MWCSFSSASSLVRSSHALRILRKHNDDDCAKIAKKIQPVLRPYADTQPFIYVANIKKAFPKVDRDSLWHTLKRIGVPSKPISIVDRLHSRTKYVIRLSTGTSDEYELQRGLREGCPSCFFISREES